VVRLLEKHRLVTVTGPGGVGKTRLAVEAAGRAGDRFPDGMRFVDFSAVRGNAQVARQMMTALGVRERPGVAPVELIAEALAPLRTLLVLDNCEHVLDAVAGVCGYLLQAGDDIRILATSREQLWVGGEARYRLSPLRLPASADPEEVGRSEAVALFADRALSADAGFTLDPANVAAVSQVVGRLDGMPLAIELAAARVEALGLGGLAGVIDDAVRLLAGRDRLAGGRHQSLTAVADWSYQLLTEADKRVLRRLAVFPGPFTLEAARAVAGPEAESAVLRLVDCSLLVPPQQGCDQRSRYAMLETLRAFVTDRLREAGEEQDAMAALCAFAVPVAETASAGLKTTDREPEALRWLDAEDATLTAALAWAEDHDRPAALRLAAGLAPWWRIRGRLTEAHTRLTAALQHATPASEGWAVATLLLGHVLYALGDWARMTDLINAVCEPGNGTDRSAWAVDALLLRALIKLNMGDFVGVDNDASRALALAGEIGCPQWEAPALTTLGAAAFFDGDVALALSRINRAGERLSGSVPGNLARWCRQQSTMILTDAEEFEWAGRECSAGMALAREVGDPKALASLFESRARLELLRGNLAAAWADTRQAAALEVRIASRAGQWNCIYLGGFLCAAAGRWAEAVTLWAAADADAVRHGDLYPTEDVYRPRRTEYTEQIERALSPAQRREASERGARMPPHAAIEFVGVLTAPGSQEVPEAPGDGKPSAERLSARESELLTLVARGSTNAQIAAQLHISIYTVRSHLDRIREKTGCRRRADLTRLAVRHSFV
jgi:predicted ATPase/DNA-binding CsgD family transcriptional regulator